MLQYRLALTLALPLGLVGCHSSTPVTPPSSNDQFAGRSIAEMQAEWDRQKAAHDAKCLTAPPETIKANQQICAREREQMAPLSNALMEAKIKAAQHSNNP
jgi:hypothetical protein